MATFLGKTVKIFAHAFLSVCLSEFILAATFLGKTVKIFAHAFLSVCLK